MASKASLFFGRVKLKFYKSLFLIALLLLPSLAFAIPQEDCISDWQGSDFSSRPIPKWLYNLFEKNNSKIFYKQFKLEKTRNIYFAKAQSDDLDTALLAAKSSALEKAKKSLKNNSDKNSASMISNLKKIADYWIEYEEDGEIFYEAYCVYASN